METVWFCEQDEFCQKVLAKHWPGVPCYPDVTELKGSDVEPIDLLCGGFPCQDLSYAGRGAGIEGARSGLWSEYARLVGELRPRYVVVENVPALLGRGLGRVLADLAALGYDTEWDCLPASAFGAPHRRDRIWIVAYPECEGPQGCRREHGLREGGGEIEAGRGRPGAREVADSKCEGLAGGKRAAPPRAGSASELERFRELVSSYWAVEPDVGRVAHGIPDRVDRLSALGNALVPQIAEWIGGRLMEYERA